MRDDLNKVLCEHERYNSSSSFKDVRRLREYDEWDDEGPLGSRESMKYRYHNWRLRKQFGENLSALYGIIQKSVGRNWDDFYSELCKVFDKRSVINQHILTHLYEYVTLKTTIKDGEVYELRSYTREWEPITKGSSEFYVHPETKIITKNKFYKQYTTVWRERHEARLKEQLKAYRNIGDKFAFAKDKESGIWFKYDYFKIDASTSPGKWVKVAVHKKIWLASGLVGEAYDEYSKSMVKFKSHKSSYAEDAIPHNMVHLNKRSASKKEIKQYNLESYATSN